MALKKEQIIECLREVGAFIEKRRPPEEIRDKLDYRGEVIKSEVVLSEIRPVFQGNGEYRANPFAKIRWVERRSEWQIFWRRADLKWHRYKPTREIRRLRDALLEIEGDPKGCFFG
jgi:Protein of unknown function (DUF3024)